jgi:glucose/arabinose dehydrogenase
MHLRTAITTALAALPGLMTAPANAVEPLTTIRVASGRPKTVLVTHAPGDTARLFVVEQRGVITILDLATNTFNAAPFLDIDALVGGGVAGNDERGLLGLAFHPDYQNNGFFYVNYTANTDGQGQEDTVVARYTRMTPDAADPNSAMMVMTFDQPQQNHNGGWIDFGPNDGFLYIATGDGGGGCDSGSGHTPNTGNSQDLTDNLLGKMLRIDIDGDDFPGDPNANYAIPPDNPFAGSPTRDEEIWAYGLRNPWRNSFDRANGDLYIADVGQSSREEIDYQEASSTGRENYGWKCMEGTLCSSASGCSSAFCGCPPAPPSMVLPIHEYAYGGSPFKCSITGGYVYRGCDIPSLDGHYFFGDFCSDQIWSFKVVAGSVTEFTERTAELAPGGGMAINDISSFGEDARGEIYIVDRGSGANGEIYKIIAQTGLGDFDCSGQITVIDFLQMLAHWGPCAVPSACPWDLDRDGLVTVADLLILLSQWGPVS